MLECKFQLDIAYELNRIELIDTCWNVNKDWECLEAIAKKELIDTCWNVN